MASMLTSVMKLEPNPNKTRTIQCWGGTVLPDRMRIVSPTLESSTEVREVKGRDRAATNCWDNVP